MSNRMPGLIVLLLAFLFASLPGQSARIRSADPIADMIARVSDSSYARYLLGLQSFGTRNALQPNRDSVASWIAHEFRGAGLTDVVVDSFSYDTTRQWNVIATIAGSEPSAGEIVIGAHYDSQSYIPWQAPGADDNASGTSAVLEIARVLRVGSYLPRHALRFVAFGAEEMGLIGSEWFASRLSNQSRTVVLMLNFDMIGRLRTDQADRDVFIVWYEGAYDEAKLDSTLFRTYTTLTPTLTVQYRTQSDSWPFARRGIKSIFHIEADFNTLLHTPQDSSTHLDFAYASDVVRGGVAMVLASDASTATRVGIANLPTEWRLDQNYPNPFNGETVIRYQVAGVGAWVSLHVYDLLGQLVATVVEGTKTPGSHSVVWDAAGLPSGTYVARLSVSGRQYHRTGTLKMTLLK